MEKEVYRTQVIEDCRLIFKTKHKLLLVLAKSGQGKTTLVRQFEESSSHPFAWVTCTKNDNSPYVLTKKIFQAIDLALAEHGTSLFGTLMLETISSAELVLLVPQIIKSHCELHPSPFTVVFDDVHLLEGAPESQRLLRGLVDATPDFITYVIISHTPLTHNNTPLFRRSEAIQVDQELLAFSREEVARLYSEVWGIPVSQERLDWLMKKTEGWLPGLIRLKNQNSLDQIEKDSPAHWAAYFSEFLVGLRDKEKQFIYLFSLLEELSVAQVKRLHLENVLPWLERMTKNSLFVHNRGKGEDAVYWLHPIFQHDIREELEEFASPYVVNEFFRAAGTVLFDSGNSEQALACFRRAAAWEDIDDILCQYTGLSPLSYHHESLLKALQEIPVVKQKCLPWVCYSLGAAFIPISIEKSEKYILMALSLFGKKKDEIGELVCIALAINYYIMLNPHLRDKMHLLQRAVDLFQKLKPTLPPNFLAKAAQALSLGFIYWRIDVANAKMYSSFYPNPAMHSNFGTSFSLILPQLLVCAMEGHLDGALRPLSKWLPIAQNHLMSLVIRMTTYFVHANFIQMKGIFLGYERSKEILKGQFSSLIQGTYFEYFFDVWDADILICKGQYRQALDIIQKTKSVSLLSPHMQSQCCHYEMMAYAHLGKYSKMFSAMRQALRLRAQGGGGFFIHLTHMLVACALVLANETRPAERIFNKVLRSPVIYHTPTAYAYRAFMRIRQGDVQLARKDASQFLQLLERFGNLHSFGLSHKVLEVVLPFAVKHKIHEKTARMLSRERLEYDIQDDGTVVPLLYVKNIGPMRLRMGKEEFSDEQISGRLKKLLALVAYSPEKKLSTMEMRTIFWPADDEEVTEGRFDAMLSRARTDFSKLFGKKLTKQHIITQQKTLCLPHCVTHEQKALELGHQGKSLFAYDRFWEAHTKFQEMAHWLGPNFLTPDFARLRRDNALEWLPETLLQWALLLKQCNGYAQALDIVEQGLALEPLDDSLHREKYTLLTLLNKPAKAALTLKEYNKILREHDFSEDQITEIIDRILCVE